MDLKQKMIVASCDVKESIMSIELMQDKQHETTALLVIITKHQYDMVIPMKLFLEHLPDFLLQLDLLYVLIAC